MYSKKTRREYYLAHRERELELMRKYQKEHKEEINKRYSKYQKANRPQFNEYMRKYFIKNPWSRTYKRIKNRIAYNESYAGLECTLRPVDLKEIWFRDKAADMSRPSIDRIDTYGGYTKENCRYIEFKENQSRQKRRRTC